MGLFNAIFRWGKAKSNEAEKKIESENNIPFAELDVEDMKKNRDVAKDNYATMKATLKQVERDLAAKKDELASRKDSAKKLKDANQLDVARKVADLCLSIMDEIVSLEQQKTMVENQCSMQEKNVQELTEDAIHAERDLKFMQAQELVTKSTESLSSIDKDGVAAAKNRMIERKQRMQLRQDKALAKIEVSTNSNLDSQIEKALGSSGEKSKNFLDSL